MRHHVLTVCLTLAVVGLTALSAPGQDEPAPVDPLAIRYGLPVNPLSYPQATPDEALKSVVRALEKKRLEYLVAQLADPRLVDGRVLEYRAAVSGGSEQARIFLAFDRFVRETDQHYLDDPQLLPALRLLARDAKWEVNDNQATGVAETVPSQKVFLRRFGARWFLENRQQQLSHDTERIMAEPLIDLRSDTVTRPTPAMRAAMSAAEVGDDVFNEDPTVHRLEERVAAVLGKETALFVPSGTMSNQIAVKVHTQPGDELICDVGCHIYNYEAGGPAILPGVTCRPLEGDYGIVEPAQFEDKIRPDDPHQVRTRLVCLENTHNRGGGRIYPLAKIEAISSWARRHSLALHLDGARLWNAVVATNVPARQWARHFDTVSVCFSKGLGAPIGSALAGPRDLIKQARRVRKLLGGGMRQAGIVAAGALYALEHHVERLAEDHRNAQVLARAIADTPGLRLAPPQVDTNLVWFRVAPEIGTAQALAERLRAHGVLVLALGAQAIRLCTHLDVSAAQAERAAEILRRVAVG